MGGFRIHRSLGQGMAISALSVIEPPVGALSTDRESEIAARIRVAKEIAGPIRLRAVHEAPYLAVGLHSLIPVATPGLRTMAVDNKYRLYFDPQVVAGWLQTDPRSAAIVMIHEVWHLLRDHTRRAVEAGVTVLTHEFWNVAADAAINDDLIEQFPVPTWPWPPVLPATIGQEEHKLEEAYYRALLNQAQEQQARSQIHILGPDGGGDPEQRGRGKAGGTSRTKDGGGSGQIKGQETGPRRCDGGSGVDGIGRDYELPGDVVGEAAGIDPAEATIVRIQVADAIKRHVESRGRGTVPHGAEAWAEELLGPARIPWRSVVRGVIENGIEKTREGDIPSWAILNQRRHPFSGILVPGTHGVVPRLGVVFDTSGSMVRRPLGAAKRELAGILDQVAGGECAVRVYSVDAAVHETKEIFRASVYVPLGGGGTDMRVGIDAAEKDGELDVLIVLTDGYTPWPDAPPRGMPVIVCLIGRSGEESTWMAPTWARVVHIPQEELEQC